MATAAGQSPELLFCAFNQDATSLQIGDYTGYTIYSIRNIDKISKQYTETCEDGMRYVERLFSSSLVAYGLHKNPRKIRAFHFGKLRKVCTQSYSNTVVAIKMNRDYMVICLEDSIIVHGIRNMKKVKHQIRDVPENKRGIIDIAPDGLSYIVYPGDAETGKAVLFDLSNMSLVKAIQAHTNPLAAVRFNPDGKLLATASTKGTVIRIFNVETSLKLFEFTRGVKRYVTISSLAFSTNSKFLCSSSNTETIHVFKLEKPVEDRSVEPSDETWTDYLTKTASSYLPTQMNELFYREKSFATARLPKMSPKNDAALRIVSGKLHLVVVTLDGYLYIYSVDNNGGECALTRQFKIAGKKEETEGDEDSANSSGSTTKHREEEDEDLQINDLDEFPPMDHTV